jgi:hypothetical protein
MWDLKPDAPDGIRGEFQPIDTSVPGIRIGELLPRIAAHAEKFAIVRSMTHGVTSHEPAIVNTLLAKKNPRPREFVPAPDDHPSTGAILHKLLGDCGDLPAWVMVPRPFSITTGSEIYKGQSAGFLGSAYDPFLLDEPKRDSLAFKDLKVSALQPDGSIDDDRIIARRQLLDSLDHAGPPRSRQVDERLDALYHSAFALLSSDDARKAFDLTRESPRLRDDYGRNEYGQSFLLARRLVEAGVRMVNVFWTYFGPDGCMFNLWDNHGIAGPVCGGPRRGIDMIKHAYCCPSFDRAFSTLLHDLAARGLLDETLVVVIGEFGRTPKINAFAGRDHWSRCYSMVLAGGGVRGGQVYGASDRHAAFVKDHPVSTDDLGATILSAFGLSPETLVYDRFGRPIRISDGNPVTALF